MRYSWKKLYVAVAAPLISSAFSMIAAAQSAYELRLGMYENAVKLAVGDDLGSLDSNISTGKERWFRRDGRDLVFCDHKLIAFRIALNPTLSSWANAVEGARHDRGEPEIKLQSTLFGEVSAKWRIAPYQTLTISMSEMRDGKLEVSRWMEDSRKCDTPAAL